MSRLIDADKLIEILEKYKFGFISNEHEREYIREVMLCFVNGMSTTYDVEKVIADLEECKIKRSDDSVYGIGVLNGYAEAIDIVKRGGIE